MTSSSKQKFLETYEKEHAITMKVLRAFPAEKAGLRPHPRCKTAKELAWVFALERGLAQMVLNKGFHAAGPHGEPPAAPEKWEDVLAGIEQGHQQLGDLLRSYTDEQLAEPVAFLVAPKTVGETPRLDFAWYLLHDEIHHRGQFSIYLRMADAKVPSIYGPSADEPWL